jgi:hypothetical protein
MIMIAGDRRGTKGRRGEGRREKVEGRCGIFIRHVLFSFLF